MIVNERLMKYYKEKEYMTILSKGLYDDYLAAKVNRHSSSRYVTCAELAKFEAFENYMAYTLQYNPQKLDSNLLFRYRRYLYKVFEENPLVMFESIMFSEDIAPLLFRNYQLENINNCRHICYSLVVKIFRQMRSGLKVKPEEQELLFKFLTASIETENQGMINLLDNMYAFFLQSGERLNLMAKEFILKYTAHLARVDLKIPPVAVYLSNTTLKGVSYTKNNYGTSYGNSSIISLNRDLIARDVSLYAEIPCIIKFMQTVCHETKHSSQNYGVSNNEMSYEAFEKARGDVFREYMKRFTFDEYQANYQHNEAERDANLYGWAMVERILKKYAPQRIAAINDVVRRNAVILYEEALANKTDGKVRRPKEIFNASQMDQIIEKRPYILDKYPQLKLIYRRTGTRKSFMHLLLDNDATNMPHADRIYYDYLIYDIEQGLLDKIDVYDLTVTEALALFKRLAIILSNEIKLVEQSMAILNDYNIVDFEEINKVRISRIHYLLGYMNRYNTVIYDLIDEEYRRYGTRILAMDMKDVEYRLRLLKRAIRGNYDIENTEIYQKLMSLEGGHVRGPKH